jgi:hypothetical protein
MGQPEMMGPTVAASCSRSPHDPTSGKLGIFDRTYVYRQCPYIKVDVKFAASSRDGELPTDKIVEVSRPYLAWFVMA